MKASMQRWIFAAGLMGLCLPAYADPAPELISGNVQFMTNYIGRGLAQSVGNPSVEGELDINSGDGPYGGIEGTSTNWVNKVYPGDDVAVEVDMWAGWRQHLGPDWVVKAGVLRLQFPGDYVPQNPPTDEPNTTELFGFVAWRAYSLRWDWSYTNAFATPDSKGSWYLDASGSQTLPSGFSLIEHVGRKHETGSNPLTGLANDRNDYTDYKVGVVYTFTDALSLTLAHTWTTANPALYTLDGYFVGGHHTWLLLEKDF